MRIPGRLRSRVLQPVPPESASYSREACPSRKNLMNGCGGYDFRPDTVQLSHHFDAKVLAIVGQKPVAFPLKYSFSSPQQLVFDNNSMGYWKHCSGVAIPNPKVARDKTVVSFNATPSIINANMYYKSVWVSNPIREKYRPVCGGIALKDKAM